MLEKVLEELNERADEAEHYHIYARGVGGQFHLCLKGLTEEESALRAAEVAEFLDVSPVSIIRVGGGQPAEEVSVVAPINLAQILGGHRGNPHLN